MNHPRVFFDEARPSTVIRHKKLFQAPAFVIDLDHSPKRQSVYRVGLADALVIVGSNAWSKEVEALAFDAGKEWIAAKSVVVQVTTPLWAQP